MVKDDGRMDEVIEMTTGEENLLNATQDFRAGQGFIFCLDS